MLILVIVFARMFSNVHRGKYGIVQVVPAFARMCMLVLLDNSGILMPVVVCVLFGRNVLRAKNGTKTATVCARISINVLHIRSGMKLTVDVGVPW